MYISNYRRRADAVFLVFFLFLFFCLGRLLFIQFFRSNYLSRIAKKQHNLFMELEPRRGTIFDTNLKPQAINIAMDSVYACPSEIKDNLKNRIAAELASILHINESALYQKLLRRKSFVWIARKVPPEQSVAIKGLNFRGIGFIKETKRCYPNSYLASQLIGFAGLDNVGLEGIELAYNRYLKGEAGWGLFLRDARQRKLDLLERMVLPKDGDDVVLTIDEVIQYIAERELDKAYKAFHARGASIIVMNPHTGEILAMANRPTFDLDEYTKSEKESRRNRAICDLFEPGSVFKIVTASAALEEKRVNERDRFFCENGSYRVANHILHDHEPLGWLTFKEVIEQSSNIGTTKVAQLLGPDIVYRYIKLFGFGDKTKIEIPGEISGMVKEPKFWSKTSIGAVPIGQEVGVTALQLVNALSVIANGGQLMKPYMIKEIRDKFGEPIKKFSPTFVRKAISIETSARMRAILAGVVEEGTGKLAKIPGYTCGGKTGTAQKIDPDGHYSHNKFFASFVGFAPADDPVIAIAVCVDEPHPYYYGGIVSAPVFKNVATDVLRYLKIKQASMGTQARSTRETAPVD